MAHPYSISGEHQLMLYRYIYIKLSNEIISVYALDNTACCLQQ